MSGRSAATPLTLRPYTAADADALIGLWFASWLSTGVASSKFKSESAFNARKAKVRARLPDSIAEGWQIFLAHAGPDFVGFIALDGDQLAQFFIGPEFQSRGYGKWLLDTVKEKRPAGFWLETQLDNYRAQSFYEREGLVRGDVLKHREYGHDIVRYYWYPRRAKA